MLNENEKVSETTPLIEFLEFNTMITPVLIQILFWMGLFTCLFGGFYLLAENGFSWEYEETKAGWALLLLGPFAVRISCESIILFYRIHSILTEIKNKLK